MTNAARNLPDDETDQRRAVRDPSLDERLKNWADEYGGGKYENIGYASKNMLQTLIEHRGEPPDSGGFKRISHRTLADEVEDAVQILLKDNDRKISRSGHIIRIEHFRPDLTVKDKIGKLRLIGVSVSENFYPEGRDLARASIKMYLQALRKLKSI